MNGKAMTHLTGDLHITVPRVRARVTPITRARVARVTGGARR